MKKLIALLLLVCTWPCFAAEALYRVDVLLLMPKHLTLTEKWLSHPALPNNDRAIALSEYSEEAPLTPFAQLPEEASGLKNTYKRLLQDDHYRVIGLQTWLQPLDKAFQSVAINLAQDDLSINGSLTLNLQHYINANANLSLNMPVANLPAGADKELRERDEANFVLAQERRMRLNEIHYLDNPMFSLLIRVTKAPALS